MGAKSQKSARLEARIAPHVLERVRQAAAIQGRSVSDFVSDAAGRAAEAAIASEHRIVLSAEDQVRFVEILLNPSPPTEALKRAHEDYRKIIVNP